MKMPTKLKQHFSTVKDIYLDSVVDILSGYQTEIIIKDIAEQQKQDPVVSQLMEEFPPSFGMRVNLTSETYRKKIEFSFSDGYLEDDNAYYNDFNFFINYLDGTAKNHSRSTWFSLKDYLTHNRMKLEYKNFFIPESFSDTYKELNQFIKVLLILLQQDDIKHILNSKNWIEVPHDKSMYF